jgi:hypothetical protein
MAKPDKEILKQQMLDACASATSYALQDANGKRIACDILRKLANDLESDSLDQGRGADRVLYG